MSVTASQLSRTGVRKESLAGIAKDQLAVIDEKLLKAQKTWGLNIVIHELPTNVGLSGLHKRNAQRVIYSTIITSLRRRGFNAYILLEADVTTLYVTWVHELGAEEIAAMNSVIKSAKINKQTRDLLLQSNGLIAPRPRPRPPPAGAAAPDWALTGNGPPPPPPARPPLAGAPPPAAGAATAPPPAARGPEQKE